MLLVISSKKVFAAKRMEQECRIQNTECRIMDVRDLVDCGFKVDIKQFDVLYVRSPYLSGSPKYIPDIIKLAKKFKTAGKRVVDSSITEGKLGQGKWPDYQKLQNASLPIPATRLLSNYQLSTINYPLVLKWTYGFKAKNVFLVKNPEQLKKILPLHPKKEWLVQEFIKAEYEYKVVTVGYKALPVVLRFKIKDSGFRTDFNKAEVIYYRRHSEGVHKADLSAEALAKVQESQIQDKEILRPESAWAQDDAVSEVIKIAEQSTRLLKRELAKVDILEAGGKLYILEVNRFPGLKSFEELTKYNVTKDFLSYLSR